MHALAAEALPRTLPRSLHTSQD